MSYYKEGTYGVALEEENIDKLFEPNEPVIIDLAQTRVDDAAGIKGHEWAQDTGLDIVSAQDVSMPFSFPCSLSLAGLLYALAMGDYAHAVNGSFYDHTCKAQVVCTNDLLPSTTWIMGLLSDHDSVMVAKGVMINELKLTLDTASRLNLTGTAFSDGEVLPVADPDTYVWPAGPSAHSIWVTGAMGDMTIDSGGGPNSVKTVLRGFDFTINNNLDVADGRSNVVNAGVFLDSLRFGNRAYNLVVRFEGHQGDARWNYMMNETVLAVVVSVVVPSGTNMGCGIVMTFPHMKVASAKQSFDGIRDVLEVTFKPFYDTETSTPVTIVVTNDVAEYLLDEV
jgi:hypothetical protein